MSNIVYFERLKVIILELNARKYPIQRICEMVNISEEIVIKIINEINEKENVK